MMRKSLKRLLERLRAAMNGTYRKGMTVRGGLQEPQRLSPLPAPVRVRP